MAKGFYGNYRVKEDEKHRFSIPVSFRPQLEIIEDGERIEKVIIAMHTHKNLRAFNESEFERLMEQIEETSLYDPEGAEMRHLFLGNSYPCVLDKQGRVLLPKPLRDFAEIDGEIVVVGIGKTFEIWSAARWDEYQEVLAQERVNPIASLGRKYKLS